jgi:hypothetical protein
VAKTKIINQTSSAIWDELVYVSLGEKEIENGLVFSLLHHLPDKPPSIYATGIIKGATIMGVESTQKIKFPLDTYGTLECKLDFTESNQFGIFYDFAEWNSRETRAEMTLLFIEQLCYDLRDRVHPISLQYKTGRLVRILSNPRVGEGNAGSHDALSDEEIAEIDGNLGLMFEFLDNNLALLNQEIHEDFSLKIVEAIWDRFVSVSEHLIVPMLGDEPKERKEWEEKRIQFFDHYIKTAQSFFSPADGGGLSQAQVQIWSYNQLQLLLKHYHMPGDSLMEMYVILRTSVTKTGSRHSDLDWILKLLKLKGFGKYVDNELRLRCEGRWIT